VGVRLARGNALSCTGFRTILTARGITVVGEAADGAEALAEARRLRPDVVCEATVKTHVARIFAKLAFRDRAQAVVLACETGLVTPDTNAAS
jgi:DNA-binding NarL/FixJ family response regulator